MKEALKSTITWMNILTAVLQSSGKQNVIAKYYDQ